MVRALLLLVLVSLGQAKEAKEVDATCTLDGGKAVEHAINAALHIWASTERCKEAKFCKTDPCPVKTLCAQDILGTVSDATALANSIVSMMESCHVIKTSNDQCGKAVGVLVQVTSGMGEMVNNVLGRCNDVHHLFPKEGGKKDLLRKTYEDGKEQHTMLGKCTLDSAEVTGKLAETVNSVHKLKCKEGVPQKYCANSVLNVVSTLSFLGSYLSGAVGKCGFIDPETGKGDWQAVMAGNPEWGARAKKLGDAGCSQSVLGLVGYMSKLSEVGIWMSDACAPKGQDARLYYDEKEPEAATGSPFMIGFAAMLPITAVLAFLGGVRFARSRQQKITREVLVDVDTIE